MGCHADRPEENLARGNERVGNRRPYCSSSSSARILASSSSRDMGQSISSSKAGFRNLTCFAIWLGQVVHDVLAPCTVAQHCSHGVRPLRSLVTMHIDRL